MVRKLLLLVVTICMAMAPGGDITVAQLQCQTAVLLLMLFLALHLWIMPFRRSLLNRLEAMCQLATTMTYGLLMFLALELSFRAYAVSGDGEGDVPGFAVALLSLMVLFNVVVLAYLLWQSARLVYKVLRQMPKVARWEERMRLHLEKAKGALCSCFTDTVHKGLVDCGDDKSLGK